MKVNAYLQTWTDGVSGALEHAGEPLGHAASNQYSRLKIAPGDVLYVAYLNDKRLHLLGRLWIDHLLTQAQADRRFGRPVWEADLHAVGERGDMAVFDLEVPGDIVSAMRFVRASGDATTLGVDANGAVNGQALQSIRRLDAASAALLDELLDDNTRSTTGSPQQRTSAAENRAVELRAMDVARVHYEADGWQVDDVSQARPYDLLCRRRDDHRHVEVKGLTGAPLRVTLTANEAHHARSCASVALVIVSEIELLRGDPPTACGGVAWSQDPWVIDAVQLRATTFSYGLRHD